MYDHPMRLITTLMIFMIATAVAHAGGDTLVISGKPPAAAKRTAVKLVAAIDGERPVALLGLFAAAVEFPTATLPRAWVKAQLAASGTVAAAFSIAAGGAWHLDAVPGGITVYRGERAAGPVTAFELRKAKGRWLVHAVWVEGAPVASASGTVARDIFAEAQLGPISTGSYATIGHGSGTASAPPATPRSTVPPPRLISLTAAGGTLAPAIIRRYVMRSFPEFTACYLPALARTPTLRGQLQAWYTIGETGAPRDARTVGFDPDVGSCVGKALEGIGYPKPDQGTVAVELVLEFRPR